MAGNGWLVCCVLEGMLVSILSVSVDSRAISWDEAALPLTKDFLSSLFLMYVYKKLNLS